MSTVAQVAQRRTYGEGTRSSGGMSDSEALRNTRFGPNPEYKGKPWGTEKAQGGGDYKGGGRRGPIPSGGRGPSAPWTKGNQRPTARRVGEQTT